jgi:hypothetical protein
VFCQSSMASVFFTRRILHATISTCSGCDVFDVFACCLSDLPGQMAYISWETGQCLGDFDQTGNGKVCLGLFTEKLLRHCCLDESAHGAKIYILDMDHERPPAIYERQSNLCLDRPQTSRAVFCESPGIGLIGLMWHFISAVMV